MIAEGINRVLALATPNLVDVGYLKYTDKTLTLITPPAAPKFDLNTLDGFVELLESGVDGFKAADTVVQVVDHSQVRLIDRAADPYGRRNVIAQASLLAGLTGFKFNTWTEHEEFVIGLLSSFVDAGDLANVVKIASSITTDASVSSEDNGFSQGTTAKTGVALKSEITIKSRVSLAPYRTFREVEQPASDFIFRVKPGALCALFEADGGKWKLDAIQNVQTWLRNRLGGSPVDNVSTIPVIA